MIPNIRRARAGLRHISARVLLIPVAGVAAMTAAGFVLTGPSDTRPTRVESFLAGEIRKLSVPFRARKLAQPSLPPSAVSGGRRVYVQACSMCHGVDGRGETAVGSAMYPPAPDLTAAATQAWKDRELFWIIRNGIRLTGMPAWRESLNDEQTWTVVAYVRKLADLNRERARRVQASGRSDRDLDRIATETIEQEECLGCHSLNGEGASVGPDLTNEWMRGRSDQWLTQHFKNPAAMTPGSVMPSFQHLSDEQVRALVAYLQQPR